MYFTKGGVAMIAKLKLHDCYADFHDLDKLYAHIGGDGRYEKLTDHLMLTVKYYNRLSKEKGIDKIIDNIICGINIGNNTIDKNLRDLIKEMFVNAIYLHDIGKINPYFQRIKMANKSFNTTAYEDCGDSRHSLLSSLIYIDCYLKKIVVFKEEKVLTFLFNILFSFAYCISRHHSDLKDLETFLDKLEDLYNRVVKNPKLLYGYEFKAIKRREFFRNSIFKSRNEMYKKLWNYDGIEYYILNKILFSLIVACDFYATYEFMSNESVIDFGSINNIKKLIGIYESTDIYKGINAYSKNKQHFGENSINSIRSELFLETEESLKDERDKNVFYIEAPTGSGKTNISINLALRLIEKRQELNKIFYIFPFNNLVDQTKKSIDKIFPFDESEIDIAVINSITPIITKEEKADNDEIVNWEKHLLNRQLLHYPIVLTTHVNFFNYLFGTGREVNLPLIHLCNSVIIIDEIQSYKNQIWTEIIMFLEKYSKLLNIKIIIMSATLPKLDRLLPKAPFVFTELVKDRWKYYNNNFFKNRVKLDFSLLELGKIDIGTLFGKVKEEVEKRKEARILIEFISRKRARKFYKLLKTEMEDKRIEEITGDDNKRFREKLFEELSEKDEKGEEVCKDIIIVATQVVEAGVDIDMDMGFKDISMLDNEEQFLGRINRSCKKNNAVAYFFHMDDARKVYKKDFRLEKDLRDKVYREYLINKTFADFYNDSFKRLGKQNKSLTEKNIKNRLLEASFLQFKDIEKNMRLIEDKFYHIYIPYVLYNQREETIDGKSLWDEYVELVLDNSMEYAEKRIKLSFIYSIMNNFIFSINIKPPAYTEEFGNIYYSEEGVPFVDKDGKFDSEGYFEEYSGDFL